MKTLAERFWPKVQRGAPDDCWLWAAGRNRGGYGTMSTGARGSVPMLAHRVAWELTHGPIRHGLCVCHRCDVRACVNPAHLFLGTIGDNNRDMYAKGRNGSTGLRGERHHRAKLTEANVSRIRELLAARVPYLEIAREFGVTIHAISDIRTGRSWRHTATKGDAT